LVVDDQVNCQSVKDIPDMNQQSPMSPTPDPQIDNRSDCIGTSMIHNADFCVVG